MKHLVSLRSLLAVAATILLVAVGACGVPTDGSPRIVALDPSTDTSFGTSLQPTATPGDTDFVVAPEVLYFLGPEGQFVPVEREIAQVSTDDRAKLLLEALVVGPTDAESARGLSSGVPPTLVINEVDVSDAGGAVFDVGAGPLATLLGDNLRLPLAQAVYTLTELDGITSVRLRVDGEDRPMSVESGSGTTDETDPVDRQDFASYDPQAEEDAPVEEGNDEDPQPATDPASGEVLTPDDEDVELPPTATPLPGTPLPSTPTQVPDATAIPTEPPEETPEADS